MPVQTKPIIHGRDHCADGADPIPCLFNVTQPGDYAAIAAEIGDLRGYWRLGETAAPFADTSGYDPLDAADLTRHTNGTAMTLDAPGALPATYDDGAVTFNYAGTTSSGNTAADWLEGNAASGDGRFDFLGAGAEMSCAVWIKPLASANTWRGGILNTLQIVTGSPNYYGGWALYMDWPTREVLFIRGGAGPTLDTATAGILAADTWHHVAATYDGTNIRLYVNGGLADTAASTVSLASSGIPIGVGQAIFSSASPPTGSTYRGRFYGSIDEAAIWGKTLTAEQVNSLASSTDAVSDTGHPAAGHVPTSDGSGGINWALPALTVNY